MNLLVESIEEKLHRVKQPVKRLSLLLEAAHAYHRIDGQKTIAYAEEALVLARKQQNREQIIASLQYIADGYFFLGEYEISILKYQVIIEEFTLLDSDPVKGTILSWLAMPLIASGQNDRALEVLKEVCRVFELNHSPKNLAYAMYKIGTLYLRRSEYKQALEYCQRSLELLKEEPDKQAEAYTLGIIARIFDAMEEYSSAISYYNNQRTLFTELSDRYGESIALGNMGWSYAKQEQYDEALRYMRQALEIQVEQQNTVHQALSHSNISHVHLSRKEFEQAFQESEQALALYQTKKNLYITLFIYHQHGKVLNALGRYDEALSFLLEAARCITSETSTAVKRDIYKEIVYSYEQLGISAKALEFHKLLHEAEIEEIKHQTDKDLRALEYRFEMQRKETEKELYRLQADQLKKDIEIQTKEVTALASQLSQKNELLRILRKEAAELSGASNERLKSIRKFVQRIEQCIEPDADPRAFDKALHELDAEFLALLKYQCPGLSKTELKICSLIKINMTSQQIADLLFTSIRTVEKHRNNIRKKLEISKSESMQYALIHRTDIDDRRTTVTIN